MKDKKYKLNLRKKTGRKKRGSLIRSSLFLLIFFLHGVSAESVFPQSVVTFLNVTDEAFVNNSERGMAAAWADYNNDGLLDLYIANYKDKNALLKNNGDGTFTDVTDIAGVGDRESSTGIAWADYNNDGLLDLFLVDGKGPGFGNKKVLYKNNGDETFTNVAEDAAIENTAFGMSVALADYDNDSFIDVFFTNNAHAMFCTGQQNTLFRNKGDGTFENVTETAGVGDLGNAMGSAWCDYDNDGDQDLYVLNFDLASLNLQPPEDTPSKFYKNNGDGTFSEIAETAGVLNEIGGMGVSWGDYNNDGHLDIYITNLKDALSISKNVLFSNNGDGTFNNITNTANVGGDEESIENTWVDYDNDGDLDLHVVNGGIAKNEPCRLYRNNGDGTFTDIASEAGIQYNGHAEGAAWGDYDNDGDMDLYLVNYNEESILFQNNGNNNHWITFQLKGTTNNRAAIGARMKITTGTSSQVRDVDGGSGFCSQDSLRVHFGLGTSDTIDSVEIRWPGGGLQTLSNVTSDQIVEITEQE